MKLHFRKLGKGQPLVILHGLFGSSDNWQTLARKFAENFCVYLVDLRNHGHSGKSDAFSYQLMADDLYELFTDEQISNAILTGHSMGGKTSMWFAQQHPALLDKLIVVDMGIREYAPHHTRTLEGLNAIDLTKVKTRGEAGRILSEYIEASAVKQFLLKNLYWVEKGRLGWRINLPVMEKEMPEILRELPDEVVHTPTLFIRGELSDYIAEDDFFSIRSNFPNSMIETVEGAGHWVHADAPALFYRLVFDFCT